MFTTQFELNHYELRPEVLWQSGSSDCTVLTGGMSHAKHRGREKSEPSIISCTSSEGEPWTAPCGQRLSSGGMRRPWSGFGISKGLCGDLKPSGDTKDH